MRTRALPAALTIVGALVAPFAASEVRSATVTGVDVSLERATISRRRIVAEGTIHARGGRMDQLDLARLVVTVSDRDILAESATFPICKRFPSGKVGCRDETRRSRLRLRPDRNRPELAHYRVDLRRRRITHPRQAPVRVHFDFSGEGLSAAAHNAACRQRRKNIVCRGASTALAANQPAHVACQPITLATPYGICDLTAAGNHVNLSSVLAAYGMKSGTSFWVETRGAKGKDASGVNVGRGGGGGYARTLTTLDSLRPFLVNDTLHYALGGRGGSASAVAYEPFSCTKPPGGTCPPLTQADMLLVAGGGGSGGDGAGDSDGGKGGDGGAFDRFTQTFLPGTSASDGQGSGSGSGGKGGGTGVGGSGGPGAGFCEVGEGNGGDGSTGGAHVSLLGVKGFTNVLLGDRPMGGGGSGGGGSPSNGAKGGGGWGAGGGGGGGCDVGSGAGGGGGGGSFSALPSISTDLADPSFGPALLPVVNNGAARLVVFPGWVSLDLTVDPGLRVEGGGMVCVNDSTTTSKRCLGAIDVGAGPFQLTTAQAGPLAVGGVWWVGACTLQGPPGSPPPSACAFDPTGKAETTLVLQVRTSAP